MQRRQYGQLLFGLSLLFSLRIIGQSIQRWMPQAWLPPFDAFQGSGLPYWALLLAQLLILAAMLHAALRIAAGAARPHRSTGKLLLWCGGIYLAGSLSRIIVGMAVEAAPAWFSTWIPALFHLVLATYVMTLACFHLQFGDRSAT